jgi:uncharacterized protein (TIGR02217 family)
MASFHENAIFPTDISYGSKGGPRFSTNITKLRSGAEERVARWSYPLHGYDVSYGLRHYDDLITVKDFFIARLGPAHGFRYRDPMDFTTEASPTLPQDFADGSTPTNLDVNIGTGNDLRVAFNLIKKYTSGGVTRNRNLTKPISGTVVVAVDGVGQTEGVDYSVDYTTGVVTFGTPPPATEAVTAGCEFHVPVRFASDLDEGLFLELTDFGGGNIPSIPLVEELQPGAVADEFYYGESGSFSFGTDIALTANSGRVIRLSPTTSGLKVALPATGDLETGGPWFYLRNVSLTNTVTITDSVGATIFTMAVNSGATIVLIDISGVKTWEGFGS